jgi:hypothetical protein
MTSSRLQTYRPAKRALSTVALLRSVEPELHRLYGTAKFSKSDSKAWRSHDLGRVDLLFKPEEGTDKVEKAQEVSGQFVKTRKYMSVLL